MISKGYICFEIMHRVLNQSYYQCCHCSSFRKKSEVTVPPETTKTSPDNKYYKGFYFKTFLCNPLEKCMHLSILQIQLFLLQVPDLDTSGIPACGIRRIYEIILSNFLLNHRLLVLCIVKFSSEGYKL